eukprot:SAG25_NODE_222_length_11605_cov_6.982357_8_plen_69_part_00
MSIDDRYSTVGHMTHESAPRLGKMTKSWVRCIALAGFWTWDACVRQSRTREYRLLEQQRHHVLTQPLI